MPRRPASQVTTPVALTRALRDFLATEAAGGAVLVVATAVALAWANSPWQTNYHSLWHTAVGVHLGDWVIELDLRHWVNDGLMAIFFLVVALEVKRELVLGELRDRRRAMLPVVAALGGMVVPALLYLAIVRSGAGTAGWGIPMATDIAFALGVLAVVAPRLPSSLRLFLLTLAIVDDIGAILVIAVVYSNDIDMTWLATAVVLLGAVVGLRAAGFATTALFAPLGVAMWVALHESGVHATLAGVAMGLLVPAAPTLTADIVRSRTDELLDVFTPESARSTSKMARESVSRLEWLEHVLHPWSSLAIVPVFALANAGITFSATSVGDALSSSVTLAVVAGLVVGKTAGISGAAWLASRTSIADMPPDIRWRQLVGVAALGGIGFTVSLFITPLAFDDETLVANAKVGILVASLLASIVGAALLRLRTSPG